MEGGAKEAQAFIDKLGIFFLLANVADVKSLVIHPASTTHSQMTEAELLNSGIKPNTVRLSIGTEHIDDLIADLSSGFGIIIIYYRKSAEKPGFVKLGFLLPLFLL